MDVLFVRKVTRAQFIGLVGAYRNGTHLDPETGHVAKRFEKLLEYRRCVKATIKGLSRLCSDGETEDAAEAEIEVLPGAVKMVIV